MAEQLGDAGEFQKEGREDLVSCLPKNIGFSIGLDFRDPNLVLNAKSTVTIREGMVFNLSIGLNKIALSDSAKANCNAKSEVSSIGMVANIYIMGVLVATVAYSLFTLYPPLFLCIYRSRIWTLMP